MLNCDACTPYSVNRPQERLHLRDSYFVCMAGAVMLAACLPNTQVVAGISEGYNRWLTEEWLARDDRLLGSLMVPSQQPLLAAEVIRKFGVHPRVVQVTLTFGSTSGYGQPHYHPIFEAAVEGLIKAVDEIKAWPIAKRQDQHVSPVQSQIRW